MAVLADEVCAMVAGVAGRQMTENQRRPEIGVMAVITLAAGDEMRSIHTRRRGAVMAIRAGTRNTIMVEIGWYPGHRGMAEVTLISS